MMDLDSRPAVIMTEKAPSKIGGLVYTILFNDGYQVRVWEEIPKENDVVIAEAIILRKKEENKNKRIPIQIAVANIPNQPETTLVALCDDGTMWQTNIFEKHQWKQIIDIPQDE